MSPALPDPHQRRHAQLDAAAAALRDAVTHDALSAHWRYLAAAALAVYESTDDGLLDWLMEAEGRRRERMAGVAAALDDLADTAIIIELPVGKRPQMTAETADLVRSLARRLREPFGLRPRNDGDE